MNEIKQTNERIARAAIEHFSRLHPEIQMNLQAWNDLVAIVECAPKKLVSHFPILKGTKDDPLAQRQTHGVGSDWLESQVKVAFADL